MRVIVVNVVLDLRAVCPQTNVLFRAADNDITVTIDACEFREKFKVAQLVDD
jgi:hypothetical protein